MVMSNIAVMWADSLMMQAVIVIRAFQLLLPISYFCELVLCSTSPISTLMLRSSRVLRFLLHILLPNPDVYIFLISIKYSWYKETVSFYLKKKKQAASLTQQAMFLDQCQTNFSQFDRHVISSQMVDGFCCVFFQHCQACDGLSSLFTVICYETQNVLGLSTWILTQLITPLWMGGWKNLLFQYLVLTQVSDTELLRPMQFFWGLELLWF